MSHERPSPSRIRPNFLDRVELALSTSRRVDRIWVGSRGSSQEELTRLEAGLRLIQQYSPVDYARIIRELERIWVNLTQSGIAEYKHSLRACVLDERYLADPATTVERIASTIVHEATHARLERYGISYEESRRVRIEAVCFRRELAFVRRLPDSGALVEDTERCLEWYQANPNYFTDVQFRERYWTSGDEALRYLGAPRWLIRGLHMLRRRSERRRGGSASPGGKQTPSP